MKAKVGDWIRFYRNGSLVIGVINYIGEGGMGNYGKEFYETDNGGVSEDGVKEVRTK